MDSRITPETGLLVGIILIAAKLRLPVRLSLVVAAAEPVKVRIVPVNVAIHDPIVYPAIRIRPHEAAPIVKVDPGMHRMKPVNATWIERPINKVSVPRDIAEAVIDVT